MCILRTNKSTSQPTNTNPTYEEWWVLYVCTPNNMFLFFFLIIDFNKISLKFYIKICSNTHTRTDDFSQLYVCMYLYKICIQFSLVLRVKKNFFLLPLSCKRICKFVVFVIVVATMPSGVCPSMDFLFLFIL